MRRAGAPRRLPEGWVVAPGLVDLQVNGFADAEVGDDPDALAAVARALPAAGLTAFCPTLVTRCDAAYRRAAAALAAVRWPPRGARALGVHLEGPFLAPSRAGVHPWHAFRDPEPGLVDHLVSAFRPALVTLTPERHGATPTPTTRSGSRPSALLIPPRAPPATRGAPGHPRPQRDARDRVARALGAGRLPRAPARGVSLVADGRHVAPPVAALVARLAGARLVLVSDATAAAGAPAGTYRLAGGACAPTATG